MKASSTRLIWIALLVTSACGGSTPDQTPRAVPAHQFIINGQLAEGQYPQVGTLVRPFPGSAALRSACSGTLIGKKVFLTAGHCIDKILVMGLQHGQYGVSFDGVYVSGISTVLYGTAYLHPQYDDYWYSNDVGIVVLDSEAVGLKTKQLARPNVLEKMKADKLAAAKIVTVGYGATVDDPSPEFRGTRRVATQHFLGLCGVECDGSPDNYWVVLGGPFKDGNGTISYGDSGGPHFLDGKIIAVSSLGDMGWSGMALEWAQRVDVKPVRDFILPFISGDEEE
jgi:secreted trypsin-like serine protease